MSNVLVGKLIEWIVGWSQSREKRPGRSLEGELRETLPDAGLQRKKEIATEMRADLKELEEKYGLFSDSTAIIREVRDTRG